MKYTKRNNLVGFFAFLLFTYLVVISSCSPSLGASWYAKSGAKSTGVPMCITSIKVAEKQVEISDPEYRSVKGESAFSKAKRFSITVPFNIKAIDIGNIQIEAYEDEKKEKPVKISYEIEGDSVPLVPTEPVSVTLRIKDDAGRFRVEEKFISVTREAPQAVDLVMQKLEVFGESATWNEDTKSASANVSYSKGASITAGDIKATFKVGNEIKTLPIVVENNEVELKVGEVVKVSCSVEEKKWEYNAYSFTLDCTRLEKKEGEEEPLKLKYLSVHKIDARTGLVKVGQEVTQITKDDVVAIFETFETLPVKLQKDIITFDSAGGAELEIIVEGKEGEYSQWKKVVHVVKEGSNESPSPDNPDDENVNPDNPEPEVPQLTNPKDENGNEKFIVKLNVTEQIIDPFDYFKENAGGFSAMEFDGWILNMTGMTSDNVASYAFLPGAWEAGNPPTCTSPDIGKGQFNHTWNLKYYKYKDQNERWEGRYAPTLDDVEKKRRERFLFFKFTGDAAMGTHLDNSMFCVDTVTKFLFYYSAPRDISSFGVPSNWRDYDEPSEGSHVHSDVPFYMTDPVGYVEKDGKCVIYGWCKQHIRKNDYTPSIDKSFRKVATRRPGGYGYSPYKDKIKKVKKERVVQANPEYTAEKPFIISQSGSVYLTVDSTEDAVVSVKVKDAPEKEELSYQWYTNAVNQTEGSTAIDGATKALHKFEKQVMDVYCWCVVTNKNTENAKIAVTTSQAVKVRIAKSAEDLKIDAETPIITEHPKSSKHSFVEGKNVEVSLQVKVRKPNDKGVLSYQWFENSQETAEGGKNIEGATEATYKASISDAGTKYYYCEVTNTNEKATGEKKVSIASAVAKVEVEELYELSVSCVGEGTLTVFGAEDAKRVVLRKDQQKEIKVKIGTELVFIAKEKQGWKIEKWEGISALKDEKTAQMEIKSKDDVKDGVSVNFTIIPREGKLGIRDVIITNINLGGRRFDVGPWGADCPDWCYLGWSIHTSYQDDDADHSFQQLWNHKTDVYVKGKGASSVSLPSEKIREEKIKFYNKKPSLKLNPELRKWDVGAFGKWTHAQFISKLDESVIEFEYDDIKDCWKVKNKKDDYNIEDVRVEFDEGFVLRRGQEKVFKVLYEVNNPRNYATGSIEVAYALSWD